MHKLAFRNPVNLTNQLFSTVRLGEKWAERTTRLEDGKPITVELVDAQGKSLGTALSLSCWVGSVVDMPAILLECVNDPIMRTWSGAAQILANCYPDAKVGYETIVTILELKYMGSILRPQLILP
jgi:hypothetical protein